MDKRRKHAYRFLLYWAMLDIRILGWSVRGWWDRVNPFRWGHARRQLMLAGDLADWLHNLALYSSNEFAHFNEQWFWRDFEIVVRRHPEAGLERYRNIFERRLEDRE